MKKTFSFAQMRIDFSFRIVNFSPSLNMHSEDTLVDRLLTMVSSKIKFFVKNVLYYYLMAKKKLRKVANNSLVKSLEKRKERKLKIFSFNSLVKKLHEIIETFPDCRKGKNISKDLKDAASKRWLRANGAKLKQLGVTITGDDLYCKQPLCKLISDEGLNFILICKEKSHKTLYEYVEFLKEDIETVEVRHWTGRRFLLDTYRFLNGVPLRDGKKALEVNWCELITTVEDSGKVVYKNTFATSFKITEKNVKQILTDGRARWKIENENNNTLKTKGYHLEHNFGHGKKYLATLLLTFNLLAFLFHTVLDLMDEKYELIRRELPTRKTFFQDIRALTRYMHFGSWNELMLFMIHGLELEVPESPESPEFFDTS